jgi:2-amino-4-hydroxy-6-hydroxymethyldihydropteridine diphosphokinase
VPTPDVLILPHPRLTERGFVLAPLAEVAPDWRHPVLGRTVREMLVALPPDGLRGMEPIDAHQGTPGDTA